MVPLGTWTGVTMSDSMGTFRVDVQVGNPVHPERTTVLQRALVDTGAELSWFPGEELRALGIERRKVWRFRQADGTALDRGTGWVTIKVVGIETVDEVVLGERGDLLLLGAHSLEGLNVRVDP